MKPLVYIAGPYQHPDPVVNTRRATEIGLQIHETGLATPIIPHLSLLAHAMFPKPVNYWYGLDLDQLEHCQVLYRFGGASHGADKEVEFADNFSIPVFFEIFEGGDILPFSFTDWCRAWLSRTSA